ncbi:MAG: hypothetical protein L0216_15920 [Planctomycetales bacterium]|nr:hypothetical protein [Planctomycetales bacterium]
MNPLLKAGCLILSLAAAPGCAELGNYFKNRARDFGEIFRLQVGLGVGLGASARLAGVADVGVGGGFADHRMGVGWVYGSGYAFSRERLADGEVFFPFTMLGDGEGGTLGRGWHSSSEATESGKAARRHVCYLALPGLFAHEPDGPLLWTPRGVEDHPWSHVHALDIEAGLYLGFVVVRAGVSPGEFLDFLLGWFGLDIAGDDTRLRPRGGAPREEE